MPVPRRLALAIALSSVVLSGSGPSTTASRSPDGGPMPMPGGPVPSDPVFTALLTDGSTASGQIRRLGESSGVTLVDDRGADRAIPLDRLVKLTREGASPPPSPEGGDLILFPDGDRLARCKVGKAGELTLGVHSAALEDVAIPLDGLLGLVLDPSSDPLGVEALVAQVRTDPRDSEVAWLRNGDKLRGLFAGLDDKKLSFQPSTGKLELPRSGVVALGFAPAQVSYRRPPGPFLELTLVDGSRLGLTGVRVERGQVVGTTRFQSEVRLPIGELSLVHAINGPVVYLSDRETSGTIYEPYVGPTRPYRRNAMVSGEVMRVGGRSYDRGLGTQSRTLLVYRLEPGSKRFQAQVGLDDRAGPLGNVVFWVRVDDKIRYESPPIAPGEPARAVDVDLLGGKLLILMTEFGERGNVQDLADWIEARIVR